MLRAGNALRFVPRDIELLLSLDLNFTQAKNGDDIGQALGRWTQTLADERPDLLDKIALDVAKVTGA